jgi:uncharacterized membrane protein
MTYTFKDFKQSAIGAFMAIVIFLAIRGNDPFFFSPTKGLVITAILVWIYYNGYRMKDKVEHFVINMVVSFGISAAVAHTFGLITTEQIFSMDVFGSLVIIATWVAFLSSMLYDRYNFYNPMQRQYVRGR